MKHRRGGLGLDLRRSTIGARVRGAGCNNAELVIELAHHALLELFRHFSSFLANIVADTAAGPTNSGARRGPPPTKTLPLTIVGVVFDAMKWNSLAGFAKLV